jgi:DNA invertase Pin-like site-specific DNA recombinase
MGSERARKEGKPHGRPCRIFDRERARELRDEGKSFREIGKIMGVDKGTIAGAVEKLDADPCIDNR